MDLYDVLLMRKFGGGGGKPSPSPSGGGEPKNVNFYDYEGTLLKSYTTDEWASVTELPENPTHEGLTAQGWNWDKADIDDYISDYPEAIVNVGQMYITDDGKTRIYVHFEKERTSPTLSLGINGTVEIDWGDGSATDTRTGVSTVNVVSVQHTYQPGDYIIKLNPTDGDFASYEGFFNTQYKNTIKKIEFGINSSIGNSGGLRNLYSLESITIPLGTLKFGQEYALQKSYSLKCVIFPKGISVSNICLGDSGVELVVLPSDFSFITDSMFSGCNHIKTITIPKMCYIINNYAFVNCWSLSSILIPKTINTRSVSIGNTAFRYCYSLGSISIGWDITKIDSSTFRDCYSLVSITIPDSVATINSYAFTGCSTMKEYHFLSTTPPSLANTNVFTSMPSDCIIYVPNESVDAYKTATNWSIYASQIQGE